ncbi:MAG: 30S ribosomal protein S1 [Desulfuromonadaceae bacterium]|nr:30S ribosomal protein S1 [Desulfuromonadaceae bacterium]
MEDHKRDAEETSEEQNVEENFADLLEESLIGAVELRPGQQMESTVLQIGKQCVFLDVGQKGEGILDRNEVLDAEENLTVAVGDKLKAYFISRSGGELRFTTRLASGMAGAEQIEEAWRSGIPVEGRIEKETKGGYEVKLSGGVRAFCPFSQLGLRRQEVAEEVIDTSRPFRVIKFGEQGRNVVVSHRALLEEAREQQREALKETLKEGIVVKGVVTSLREFGAFIDIGGIEGLLPISEVGYGRVEDIGQVLQVDQELEVAVKKIDWEANRFSFSLRDTLADPWSKVGSIYVEGGSYPGTVARVAQFGAFVTLEDGIDGLLHISRLGGGRRLKHAQEVVKTGQALTVTIEKIDLDQRRISLVPVAGEGQDVEAGESASSRSSYEDVPTGGGSMGTLGDILKAKLAKQKKS